MVTIWTIAVGGYLLTLLLIPWVLVKKTVDPSAAAAWIMAILFVPYLGPLLCLVFGVNRLERRKERKRAARSYIGGRLPALSAWQVTSVEDLIPSRPLLRLTNGIAETRPTYGNQAVLLPETQRAFDLIEEAILSARESVHVQFYIWRPDETGTRLRDLLIRKAGEGLTVRFLYDGIGSMWLGRRFLRPMTEAGIHLSPFLPGPSFRERWSVNLRNHRKIVIVDGRVGFTGGMNVGNEYLGKNPYFGYWRDTQLMLRGPAVLQLQQVFVEDWYYATQEELTRRELFPDPEESGNVAAQVLADGPDRPHEVHHSLMFAAINAAESRVTVSTSYFVPPVPLAMALETAARRGVDVRILVAKKATYAWTLLAGRAYYESLLDAGVKIYEYQKGLFHAKTLTIDGTWSLVGTTNFDMRSLMLNFEVGVALYDAKLAAELEEHFERDVLDAQRIDPDRWKRRSISHVIAERFWRLFAPVL